jgi:hypothetical protein
MLKQNLDFIAVAIVVLVMGVVQAPKLGVHVARFAMEQQSVQMRNVRLERSVSLPSPPLPPLVVEKFRIYH